MNGPVPVNRIDRSVFNPSQIDVVPVNAAVGKGFTVIAADPETEPAQFASLIVTRLNVVEVAGPTVTVAGLLFVEKGPKVVVPLE